MINFTTLQVSDMQTDYLFELDKSIIDYIDICYHYNELFNNDKYSFESLSDKIKNISKNAIHFVIKLFNKCIASLTSLWKLLKTVIKQAIESLRKVFTGKKEKTKNQSDSTSTKAPEEKPKDNTKKPAPSDQNPPDKNTPKPSTVQYNTTNTDTVDDGLIKGKIDVLTHWYNDLYRYSRSDLYKEGLILEKLPENGLATRIAKFEGSNTDVDSDSPNNKHDKTVNKDKAEEIKNIKENLEKVTKFYSDKYNNAKSVPNTYKFELKIQDGWIMHVVGIITALKRTRDYYNKLLSQKLDDKTVAEVDAEEKENSKGLNFIIEEEKHSSINKKIEHHGETHLPGRIRYDETFSSRSMKRLQYMVKYIIDYSVAMQKALAIWLKYCRNTIQLVNKAHGGTGNKGVLMFFNVPDSVKKELGEYFGRYHDQGKTLPLKINKVIVYDSRDDNASAMHAHGVHIVNIELGNFTHNTFDELVRTILHELAHVSQNNRNVVRTEPNEWRPDHPHEYIEQRYKISDHGEYRFGGGHDKEFVEKHADKIAAQFVHDVNSGKISSSCATYTWIKDMKSKIEDYMKKHNIKNTMDRSVDSHNASKKRLSDRFETNRKEALPLQSNPNNRQLTVVKKK